MLSLSLVVTLSEAKNAFHLQLGRPANRGSNNQLGYGPQPGERLADSGAKWYH